MSAAVEAQLANNDKPTEEKTNTEVVKHPLQSEWDFWYFKQDKNKSWEDSLMNIASFNTVEDFWALFNHIQQPSQLDSYCDYNMFRSGVKPMWEDPRNRQGGRLVFLINKRLQKLNQTWLEVLLCLIGEAFGEESDEVCGAVVNVRPKLDRISIWTRNTKNETAIRKLAAILKERTGFFSQVSYESHKDSGKGDKNPLYML